MLYEVITVSAGRRFPGMENWLPLFTDGLDTLFAYVPEAVVVFDAALGESLTAAWDQIGEYYAARKAAESVKDGSAPYHNNFV